MGVFIRGAKNAFRNTVRTLSVTLILAISIGLALVMLLSYRAVQAKIVSVTSSIGNVITVTPAGAQGFEGGGEPLTGTALSALSGLAHVTGVSETLNDRLNPGTDTSLATAIDPGTLGNRQGRFNRGGNVTIPGGAGGSAQPRTFTVPIVVTGLSDPASMVTGTTVLTSGELFDGSSDQAIALVGKDLAEKNNLSVGSTFTAYGKDITVKGIFDASGNRFANSGLAMPIKALQTLSDQADQVSLATVHVDSVTNMDAAVEAVKAKLGSDKADVTSTADTAKQAIAPLENIRTISLYSLIGALVAGAVITLLTMVMIVRERRREIGVLKAIGASNLSVVTQFVSESLVLTLMGSVVGVIAGVALSNPVLNALVSSNVSAANPGGGPGPGGGRGFRQVIQLGGQLGGSVQNAVRDVHATVGTEIILYGLAVALLIAILGSALPAWLIAKVRPAEVMRGE